MPRSRQFSKSIRKTLNPLCPSSDKWYMTCREILSLGLLLLVLAPTATTNSMAELGDDVLLPITDNWVVRQGSEQPYLLTTIDNTAELKIFRSVIDSEHAIHNTQEFRVSVDSIIDNVILNLPRGQLISSTGYGGGYQVSFALEFETINRNSTATLRHRLVGVLMRHSDGYQLLYTLWGRASLDAMAVFGDELELIQDGFIFRGATQDNPFVSDPDDYEVIWLSLPLFLVLAIVLAWRRRRRPLDSTKWVKQWLCRCGQANDLSLPVCSRCSDPRQIDEIS